MGLDNYPVPYPCKARDEAGKLKLVQDEDGDPECKATNCPFKPLPTGCWIRGKVFNKYVHKCCGESLYEDKTREELDFVSKFSYFIIITFIFQSTKHFLMMSHQKSFII